MALFGYLDWVMIIVKRLLQLLYDASTISGSKLTSSFICLAKEEYYVVQIRLYRTRSKLI
ncbi:hypothetical protein TorRG33x02_169800 [Trema orientale]|uniref:Uncharacterized protein n=1 Tax=Trema orientale TaxID=63057 RepID=A0A2P5ENT0_TREOI|nr:hypothetical protein TorRG33x02_169800 [Trema orientale]